MLEWAQFVLGWPAQMEKSRGEMGGHPCMLTELPMLAKWISLCMLVDVVADPLLL